MPQRLFYSGATWVLHASGQEPRTAAAGLGARSLAGVSGLFNWFFLAFSARRR